MPTTRYVSRRRRRRRTGILDSLRDEPSAPHWPLIWMLLLSQLSLGVLLFERILTIAFTMVTERAGFIPVQRSLALCASASAIAAVLVGPLHLGRPWLAFRSILGWRTSWLSREVIGLGAFAAASTAHVVLLFNRLDWGLPRWVTHLSGFNALAVGCIAVACSAMVYVATHRDAWSGRRVFREFGFSTLALGVTSALFALGIARLFSVPFRGSPAGVVSICVLLHVAAILNSGRMFKHRALLQMASNEQSGAATGIESRIARLLSGPLLKVTQWRGRLGFLSGLLIPLLVASQPPYAQASLSLGHILFQLFLLSSTVILQSGSELLNKYLFFVTAVTKRMPRGMP